MILVTGGTGLVGAHLLLKLVSSEKNVRAIYRNDNLEKVKQTFTYYHNPTETEALLEKIEWVKADVLDIPALTKAFKNVTHVYHCAAMVSFNVSDEKEMRKINIEGTANVVNLCISCKVEKLCYVSSIATLSKEINSSEITETSSWNPEINHSAYAISKYGAEIEVWRGTQEGVPAVIVNPGIIIGPGNWHSGSGVIFSKIKKGLNYYFPKVEGFVGVEDVVTAMIALMKSNIQNEQFILVSENLSFKDVFQKTALALGKKPPQKKLKPWMVQVGWLLQLFGSIFGKKRKLTHYSKNDLFQKSFYSSEKIKERLPFKFTPMDTVIEETARFFKNEETGH